MTGAGNCTCKPAQLPEYCRTDDGTLPAGLCYVESFLSDAAGPARELLLNRWALVVGAVMFMQFHVVPCFRNRFKDPRWMDDWKWAMNFVRSLGRQIIILNIYYSTAYGEMELSVLSVLPVLHTKDHQPLIESVTFAFFESVLLYKLFHGHHREEEKVKVITKFADLSVPWTLAAITFVAQFMLFLIFILDMNGDRKTHCECKMNIFHWFVAVLVTNVSGIDESGETFRASAWKYLKNDSPSEYNVMNHRVQYWSRCFCDGTINAFCREVLLCLAPVALSVSDRDDLVKDCLAIFFISRMDDMEPKNIEQTLKDWKPEVTKTGSLPEDWKPETHGRREEPSDGPEGRGPLLQDLA